MTTLLILQRYWKLIGVGALVLVIAVLLGINSHLSKQRDTARQDAAQARAALQTQIATYQAAAKEAETKAQATEARNAQIQQETQNDLQAQLAAARASAADYARRLRDAGTKANPGSGASVPQVADAAGSADGASRATELDADLRICSENTVIAAGWQDWWARIVAGQ